jgi:hypothetical protein
MRSIRIVAALLVVLLPERLLAWNIPGHMLSVAIAHQVLQQESPQMIDKVKAVLAQHPWRFNHWQNSLASFTGSDTDVMLFMLAARWTDDIRSNDKPQHRGPWHYVNMPFKPAGRPAHIQTKPGRYSKHTGGTG